MLAKIISGSWRWFLNMLLSVGLMFGVCSNSSVISWTFGDIPTFLDFSKVFTSWNPVKWNFEKFPDVLNNGSLPQLKVFIGFTLILWFFLEITDIPVRKFLGDKKQYRWQIIGFAMKAFQGWLCLVVVSVFGKFAFAQATFLGIVTGFLFAICRLSPRD